MIKPYTWSTLSDDLESENAEFINYFDGLDGTETPPIAMDIEAKARKVFEDAYVQGEKAGYEMGLKKVDQLLKRLNGYVTELAPFKAQLMERCEHLSVELALVFAEAVTLKECEEKRETIIAMARKALELCEEKSNIVLRIRRDDAQYFSREDLSPIEIVPDDTMKEPGFIIETKLGDIDGRIFTQIEELRKKITNGQTR
jgi:flagellar biosynthesis/type III secretory pathway protein FliH